MEALSVRTSGRPLIDVFAGILTVKVLVGGGKDDEVRYSRRQPERL